MILKFEQKQLFYFSFVVPLLGFRGFHNICCRKENIEDMAGGGLFKFVKPGLRPQSTDIQAAVGWGVAAGTTAIWVVQPFSWIKKTFFEKAEEGK